MKKIENRMVYVGGYLSYFMSRTLPDGGAYRYAMHLSSNEAANGRDYIARRLRQARKNMRESIENLAGLGIKGRRDWVEGL